jgi:hypothetical protein
LNISNQTLYHFPNFFTSPHSRPLTCVSDLTCVNCLHSPRTMMQRYCHRPSPWKAVGSNLGQDTDCSDLSVCGFTQYLQQPFKWTTTASLHTPILPSGIV